MTVVHLSCLILQPFVSKRQRHISPDQLALVLSAQEEIIDDEDPVPPADTTADKSELESALQMAVSEDDLAGLLKAAGVAQVRTVD